MRLYPDASPLIYWVENVTPYSSLVEVRIKQAGMVLVSSNLTRMECLVRPLRLGSVKLLQDYDDFFNAHVQEIVPFTEAVFRRAAQIRAVHNFKTPDALHLAAALESACDVFLTNDAQLTQFNGIAVDVIC